MKTQSFTYAVTVYAEDQAQADRVLSERLDRNDQRTLPVVSSRRTLLATRTVGEWPPRIVRQGESI